MAATAGTIWGSIYSSYYRLGLYTKVTTSGNTASVTAEVWLWTKYGTSDSSNNVYFDCLASKGSATTNRGSKSVNTTVNTGSGWSESNQMLLYSFTSTYTMQTAAATRYLYAKITGLGSAAATVETSGTVTIPALPTYSIKYNANGGSGAPGAQIKYYGVNLKLATATPTRDGYIFKGWATSSTGSVSYGAGGNYTANASATLYAVWQVAYYTISYNANGGSGAPGAQTKNKGATLTLSETKPTRTNYDFLGWSTSKSGVVMYDPGGLYTADASATLYAIWRSNYTAPRVTGIVLKRCDSAGVDSVTGTYAKISFAWETDKEVSSIKMEWRAYGSASVLGSATLTASGTSGTVTDYVFGSGGLAINTNYNILITVTDANGGKPYSALLPNTTPTIAEREGGNGVAFGGIPESLSSWAGWAQFFYDVLFRQKAVFNNNIQLCGKNTSGEEYSNFEPKNSGNNTTVGKGNFDKKSGTTTVYGHDVYIGVSNLEASASYRPYYRKGDTVTILLDTAGFLTGANKLVQFTIPLDKPIIGSPVITVASTDGFMLRQNNQYTHGSSSSAFVKPASIGSIAHTATGLRVIATFNTTTNSINNSPIGIAFRGTITFS